MASSHRRKAGEWLARAPYGTRFFGRGCRRGAQCRRTRMAGCVASNPRRKYVKRDHWPLERNALYHCELHNDADRKRTHQPLAMGWYPPLARKDSTGEFLLLLRTYSACRVAPLRSGSTEMSQTLSSHSGT